MTPFLAEFLGTAILVILGNGVVSNVLLKGTKGNGAGWIVITFGWGMAVFVGVFCTSEYSGAHLNPAVTIAAAAAHKFEGKFFRSWADVPLYLAAQMAGAIIGAIIVYFFYKPYFDATEDSNAKLGCFATAPNIRSMGNAFFCELIGTFTLVLPIFLMMKPSLSLAFGSDTGTRTTATTTSGGIGLGALGGLPVGLLVLAIGLSLGGTTGYAINPARDLGPRIAHFILPIRGKRDSDWSYSWVPVLGPIAGGLLAALVARIVLPPHV
jgi:glycerol uptake facilitator protein